MDNAAYIQDPEKGTELSLVETTEPGDVENVSKPLKDIISSRRSANRDPETQPSRVRIDKPPSNQANNTQSKPKSGGISNRDQQITTTSGGSGGRQPEPGPSTSCRPEVCQRARERYTAPDLRGSPWHRSKTIFLLVTIAALVIWAIVYGTLSKLNII